MRSYKQVRFASSKIREAGQINTLLFNFKQLEGIIGENLEVMLEDIGHIILKNALPLTPLDTGALRRSGRVITGRTNKGAPSVTVAFGGPGVSYALVVHEDTTKTYREPGTGPKFLDIGFQLSKAEIDAYISKNAKKVAGER